MTETSFMAGELAGWECGSGPALLFLHGGPGVSENAAMVTPEAAGWRFITFQQRGVTPSTTNGPFTIEQNVADAVAVLDARGVERAVVVGHSWGGHLALHLAVAHPDRVCGLVLIDGLGVPGDGGVDQLKQELDEMGEEMKARLLPAAAERFRELTEQLGDAYPTDEQDAEMFLQLWPSHFADPASAPPRWDIRVCLAANEEAMDSAFERLEAGFADELSTIGIPVVSVLGEQSPLPVSQGERTAALIPGAEVRIIPAAGHLPWFEQPGCIAAALTRVSDRIAAEDLSAR
jgi:pimeloyl-ACP methyl ester carboxylesterase